MASCVLLRNCIHHSKCWSQSGKLCVAFTYYDSISACVVLRPDRLHKHVDQDGVEES